MAARLDAARRHAGFGVLHLVNDALAVFEKGRAFEGQRDLARGAHQQFDAETLFERVDAAADDGRRDAFGRSRGRQAAFGRDGHESLDLLETVHERWEPRFGGKVVGARQIRWMKVKDQVMFSLFFSA